MPPVLTFNTADGMTEECGIVYRTETDLQNGTGLVYAYRFGWKGKDIDWTSPRRQKEKGNFARPSADKLNSLALSQVRFGRKGAVGPDTPFISVATSYERLYQNGEPWVQNLLKDVPDLGVFLVPYACIMRPTINSHATRAETEWLFYDGDHEIRDYLERWDANPYKK